MGVNMNLSMGYCNDDDWTFTGMDTKMCRSNIFTIEV